MLRQAPSASANVREGRTADLDRAIVLVKRSPTRQIAGTSVKARTGGAPEADHKREAIAARAPYLHVLDGPVKLQWHGNDPLQSRVALNDKSEINILNTEVQIEIRGSAPQVPQEFRGEWKMAARCPRTLNNSHHLNKSLG